MIPLEMPRTVRTLNPFFLLPGVLPPNSLIYLPLLCSLSCCRPLSQLISSLDPRQDGLAPLDRRALPCPLHVGQGEEDRAVYARGDLGDSLIRTRILLPFGLKAAYKVGGRTAAATRRAGSRGMQIG